MQTNILIVDDKEVTIINNPVSMEGFVVGASMIPVLVEGQRIFVPLHKVDSQNFRGIADCIDIGEKNHETCLILFRPSKSELGVLVAEGASDGIIAKNQ